MQHKKKFVFEITVEAEPYNEETCQGYYNPDFSTDTYAKEIIGGILLDAICSAIASKISYLTGNNIPDSNTEPILQYLNERIAKAKNVEKTLKFVRIQETE